VVKAINSDEQNVGFGLGLDRQQRLGRGGQNEQEDQDRVFPDRDPVTRSGLVNLAPRRVEGVEHLL
jgi:hypothetical protein